MEVLVLRGYVTLRRSPDGTEPCPMKLSRAEQPRCPTSAEWRSIPSLRWPSVAWTGPADRYYPGRPACGTPAGELARESAAPSYPAAGVTSRSLGFLRRLGRWLTRGLHSPRRRLVSPVRFLG